jgi:primase-polymerase (primpol)-like protein
MNYRTEGDYSTVHEGLKQRRAFVVWKLETVPERDTPTKVPYSPVTHTRARSTDSLTWASFDEALAAYEAGGYDGVGYVLSSGDPYTFIDLDNAINADERARLLAEGSDDRFAGLKPWARFVRDIAPYAYIGLSQSGAGLHIIMRGKLPGTGRKTPVTKNGLTVGEIEMYDQSRFIALTGVTL